MGPAIMGHKSLLRLLSKENSAARGYEQMWYIRARNAAAAATQSMTTPKNFLSSPRWEKKAIDPTSAPPAIPPAPADNRGSSLHGKRA